MNYYYAVLTSEQFGTRAGSIFIVKKTHNEMVEGYRCDIDKNGQVVQQKSRIVITKKVARKIFTTPTKDWNSALEESFMQCEANYC